MLFQLFRYDFRFPRYYRAKKKLIFSRLLFPSLFFARISSHWPTPNFRQAAVAIPGRNSNTQFQEKKVGHSVADPFIIYVNVYVKCLRKVLRTLNRYISAINWDIETNQRKISMVFSILCIFAIKFLIFMSWFLHKISFVITIGILLLFYKYVAIYFTFYDIFYY